MQNFTLVLINPFLNACIHHIYSISSKYNWRSLCKVPSQEHLDSVKQRFVIFHNITDSLIDGGKVMLMLHQNLIYNNEYYLFQNLFQH